MPRPRHAQPTRPSRHRRFQPPPRKVAPPPIPPAVRRKQIRRGF